jgi:prepilin-type N-terminal cleavage/methylation domain-containing protein
MKHNGMSLLETLVGLTVMGVVIALASFPFVNLSPKYKLLRAVREVHSRMNYARYRAIYSGTSVRLRLDPDGYRIEVHERTKDQWISGPKCFLAGVRIEANNTPTFHPIGTVSHLCTIRVMNSWGSFKLTLAISGRIKVVQLEPIPKS